MKNCIVTWTKISFQDEFRLLLKRYELEFDERYVWIDSTPLGLMEFWPLAQPIVNLLNMGQNQKC